MCDRPIVPMKETPQEDQLKLIQVAGPNLFACNVLPMKYPYIIYL